MVWAIVIVLKQQLVSLPSLINFFTFLTFIVLGDKLVRFRKCQPESEMFSGNCHHLKLLEANTTICFCNSDGCNGSNHIPFINHKVLLVTVFIIFLIRNILLMSEDELYKVL